MQAAAAKTIIITGTNRGLGLGMLKALAQGSSQKYNFIMAVRSTEKGQEALESLSKEIPDIKERTGVKDLDPTSSSSIDSFVEWVKEKYGSVDCLVNNAGVAIKGEKFSMDLVKRTFAINVHGTIELTEKLLPYINNKGKVVILGSQCGLVSVLNSEDIKKEFLGPRITKEKFNQLIDDFYKAVEEGEPVKRGWTDDAYDASKVFIDSYPKVLAGLHEITKKNIQVYSCCPGYVRTDMNKGENAPRSIEEGVACPVWLVNLPWEVNEEYQGKFFHDCKIKPLEEEAVWF